MIMKKIFFAAFAALALFSCGPKAEPEVIVDETGGIRLSVIGDGSIDLVTKSTELNIDYSALAIKIIDLGTQEEVNSFAYNAIPEMIKLDKGQYKVVVETEGVALPIFNKPVFRGEETVTIVPGEITQLKVTVSVACTKVSVLLDKTFTDEVTEDYSVSLLTYGGETILFKKSNIDAGDAAFIVSEDFDLIVKAIRKSNGASVSKAYSFQDVKAKSHYIFTIKAIATGTLASGDDFIVIDDSYTDRDENVLIDGFEQNPIKDEEPENPGQDPDPVENNIVITAPGITAPVTYVQGQGVPAGQKFIMSATVPEGVEKFEVSVPSADLRDMLDAVDQPYSVDLASMSGDQLDFWGGLLGITNPATEVKGKTQVDFDVTTFIALMPAATNVMELKVTDTKGQTKEAKVQIIITPAN